MTHLVDEEPCSGCPHCNPDMATILRTTNHGNFKGAVRAGERILEKLFPRWMGGGKMATGTCFFPAKPPSDEKERLMRILDKIPPPTTNKEKQMTTTNIPSPPLSNQTDAIADPVAHAKKIVQQESELQKRPPPQGGLLSIPVGPYSDPLVEMIRKNRGK